MSSNGIVRPPKRARSGNTVQDASSDRIRPLQGRLNMNHIIEFQQSGDVLILVENYSLLVSSEKLCAISAVFAAMLNGRFREGRKIFLGSLLVHQVSLPDEDIDSVLLLCKIIYKRDDLIEEVPNGHSLFRLAVLCDKYQCATALKTGLGNLTIGSLYLCNKNDTESFCTMLLVAYIMDCEVEFQAISGMILDSFRELALDEKGRLSFYHLLYHPLIRVSFHTAFESKFNDINQQIDRMFSDLFQKLRDCSCGGHPNTRAKRAGSFMEQLFKAELMPTDIPKVSITETKKRVEKLGEVPCHHFSYREAPSKSLKQMLTEEMQNIQAGGIGLCLDCVNLNNRSGVSGRCRTSHTITA